MGLKMVDEVPDFGNRKPLGYWLAEADKFLASNKPAASFSEKGVNVKNAYASLRRASAIKGGFTVKMDKGEVWLVRA
jgi:hypothetical protein